MIFVLIFVYHLRDINSNCGNSILAKFNNYRSYAIQNKVLTCAREVGDPILSQNIDLMYAVPKAKQRVKNAIRYLKMLKRPWDRLFRVNAQAEVTHGR